MDTVLIRGGGKLRGEVTVSGAKNAAVAVIPAVLLCDEPCRIDNVPSISDVANITQILHEMGAEVRAVSRSCWEIDPRHVNTYTVSHEMSKRMRASTYLIGALLGRFSRARVAPPGGCNFGVRPIDQHIKGFEALGAAVTIDGGMVDSRADRLIGGSVYLDVVSVGATVNIMLAAARAQGLTVIENAAREPHIVDLANFLNSMGADIRGAGTDIIKIRGVQRLHGASYTIIPDQIEAGTYMAAAAATGGNVLVRGVIPKHLESIGAKLIEAGAVVEEFDDAVRITRPGALRRCNVKTMPHPGFPTDMQPQLTTLLSIAEGTSIITESVWDNRFRYVDELTRMGAQIQVDGKVAVVEGVSGLTAAPVRAVDLRAGAALLIAGLVASGMTRIEDIEHIERGYEDIVEKLRGLGADIRYGMLRDVPAAKAIS